jgi:methylmalonyl-CoA/ethylmalonyl-CoA epimerase
MKSPASTISVCSSTTSPQAEKKATDAGAEYLAGRPTSPDSFYECKYRDPDGIVFDITHNGWVGAVKDVTPVKEKAAADA